MTRSVTELSRIGLIGDVHAEDERLARALEFLETAAVQAMLCAGDVVDGEGDVARCCRLLSDARVTTVRGNHERWFLAGEARDLPHATPPEGVPEAARRFLSSLPPTVELRSSAGPVLLCHGLGQNDMALLKPDDYGYAIEVNDELQRLIRSGRFRNVLCGHTHVRMVRHFDGVTFINAGTLLRDRRPGFAVVALEQRAAQFYDVTPHAVEPAECVPLDGDDWPPR